MQGALMHRNPAKNPKPKCKSKILKLAQIMNSHETKSCWIIILLTSSYIHVHKAAKNIAAALKCRAHGVNIQVVQQLSSLH